MTWLLAFAPLGLAKLGGLAAVVLGLVAWTRRRGVSGAPGLRTIRLTAQHALHVVPVEGRLVLVGTGPADAPRLLTELDAKPAAGGEPTGAVAALAGGGPRGD